MTTLVRQNDVFTLNIPNDLITDKLVQKLIRLVTFRELTKNNAMTENKQPTLPKKFKKNGGKKTKIGFLKTFKNERFSNFFEN